MGRKKEDNLNVQVREKVLSEIRLLESVREWWEENSMMLLRAGQEVLGMSTNTVTNMQSVHVMIRL